MPMLKTRRRHVIPTSPVLPMRRPMPRQALPFSPRHQLRPSLRRQPPPNISRIAHSPIVRCPCFSMFRHTQTHPKGWTPNKHEIPVGCPPFRVFVPTTSPALPWNARFISLAALAPLATAHTPAQSAPRQATSRTAAKTPSLKSLNITSWPQSFFSDRILMDLKTLRPALWDGRQLLRTKSRLILLALPPISRILPPAACESEDSVREGRAVNRVPGNHCGSWDFHSPR
jgi:hypothetical protein